MYLWTYRKAIAYCTISMIEIISIKVINGNNSTQRFVSIEYQVDCEPLATNWYRFERKKNVRILLIVIENTSEILELEGNEASC